MKSKTPEMRAHLDQDVTTLATLWRVTRKDGEVFRFTDHDRDIALPSGGSGVSTVWSNFTTPVEIHNGGVDYWLPAPPPTDTIALPAEASVGFSTGKHFYEVTKNNHGDGTSYDFAAIGIAKPGWSITASTFTGINAYFQGFFLKEDTTTGSASSGDITLFPATIGVAFDGDANTVTFYVNGTNVGTLLTTAGQVYKPLIGGFRQPALGTYETNCHTNFGSEPFLFPPIGWEGVIWGSASVPGTPEVFLAGTGYTRSAIQNSADLSADNLDVDGILEDASLKPEEIRAGLFDQSRVEIMLVNWQDPSMGVIKLRRGTMGELVMTPDGTFKGELRGLTQQLSQNIGEIYQPECRADLGDSRCKLDLTPFTTAATIASVTNRKTFTVTYSDPQVIANWFNGGRATFTSGSNSGKSIEIKSFNLGTGEIVLHLGIGYLPISGDTVNLIPGCDKRRQTCQGTFDNYLNFRGEPFIPGNDELLKYPNATS